MQPDPENQPILLKVAHVAALLSVSESTVYRMTSSNELPSLRLGKGKHQAIRVPLLGLNEWLAAQGGPAGAGAVSRAQEIFAITPARHPVGSGRRPPPTGPSRARVQPPPGHGAGSRSVRARRRRWPEPTRRLGDGRAAHRTTTEKETHEKAQK